MRAVRHWLAVLGIAMLMVCGLSYPFPRDIPVAPAQTRGVSAPTLFLDVQLPTLGVDG
jgi:hypothetical protein